MLHKVTRSSLCLRKVLSRSRLLYVDSHRHEHNRFNGVHTGCKYSDSTVLRIHSRCCVLLNKKLNVCWDKRFFSDFKDDDMVKSWLKEIKEDFENKKTDESKTTESSQDYFKDIENVKDVMDKIEIGKSTNLSLTEQISLQKLEELANKYAGVEASEANTSSSDSDSDRLSSASDSDSSDDERSSDKRLATEQLEATKGFTKEEMIEMLKTTPIKEASESDLEELDNDLAKKSNVSSNATDSSKLANFPRDNASEHADIARENAGGSATSSARDDSGLAATRVGEDGLKEDWAVVEIEDFVNITPAPDVEPAWVPPISLQRGKTGVFDLDEIVTLLRSANAFDIVVIRLPRSAQLGDYMVIASAKSLRQLSAIARDIQWIYKQRVKKKGNVHLRVEGEKTSWQAMDTGNIFIHLFQPEVREQYDLETLWTLGPEFDEKCKTEGTDPYVFSMDELPWLRELEDGNRPSDESKQGTEFGQWEPAQDVTRNQ